MTTGEFSDVPSDMFSMPHHHISYLKYISLQESNVALLVALSAPCVLQSTSSETGHIVKRLLENGPVVDQHVENEQKLREAT